MCKAMIKISNQPTNRSQPETEFDDKIISQTPSSKINQSIPHLMLKKEPGKEESDQRKEKIKNRMKNQFRKKIVDLSSHPNSSMLLKSPQFADVRYKYKRVPKVNSEIFQIRNISVPH